MARNRYFDDIEKAIRGEVNPIDAFNASLALLNFKTVEVKIYDLLLKTSLTIKEIQGQLDVSERSIRMHIKKLEEEGLITKKVEQGTRLRYVYQSVQIQEAWEKVEEKINRMLDDISKVIETAGPASRNGAKE
ncbi:MAG: winged helix-turn-helix domain-containing protein [Methanomassiliicoccales archaeon]